jgi:tRNA U34 5-methylaminomethyl-2-thiouridine-forming methyltransferase MnmC
MDLEIIKTLDGSHTFLHKGVNQHYHSTFGAIQESRHIFIESGLKAVFANPGKSSNGYQTAPKVVESSAFGKLTSYIRDSPFAVHILEIGFGTGLNALLTLIEAEKSGIRVLYTSLEAFPLEGDYWKLLNYPHSIESDDYSEIFTTLHLANWNEPLNISPCFTLHKIHTTLEAFLPLSGIFNLVYFDAFGPDAQPELWEEQIFGKIHKGMSAGGILMTYSVKGIVVRAMRSAGFKTEKLPGPPGKRHILRAIK